MATRARRTPTVWPWWGRLLAWLTALAVLLTVFLAAVGTGSAETTQYAATSSGRVAPSGAPATSVQQLTTRKVAGSWPSALVGPTVATFDATGVVGRDAGSGATVWSYHRTDARTCATGATRDSVVLVVGRDGRCDEAIAFDAATGARGMQRTLEAGTPSTVTIDGYSLIAYSRSRMVVVDLTSGFERFRYVAPAGGADDPSTCEILDATGESSVSALLRCRTAATEPWTYAVVAITAAKDTGTEIARYDAGRQRPDLVGTLGDGSAVVRLSTGALVVAPVRGTPAVPLSGIPTSDGGSATVVRGGLGDLVVVGPRVFALDATRTTVIWSAPTQALPTVLPDSVAVLSTPTQISYLDFGQGVARTTTTLPTVPPGTLPAGGTPPAVRLQVAGSTLAVVGAHAVTTYG